MTELIEMYCVRCGEAQTDDRAKECAVDRLPPCCPGCEGDVRRVLKQDAGMWPSDWHGKARRYRDGEWWYEGYGHEYWSMKSWRHEYTKDRD